MTRRWIAPPGGGPAPVPPVAPVAPVTRREGGKPTPIHRTSPVQEPAVSDLGVWTVGPEVAPVVPALPGRPAQLVQLVEPVRSAHPDLCDPDACQDLKIPDRFRPGVPPKFCSRHWDSWMGTHPTPRSDS